MCGGVSSYYTGAVTLDRTFSGSYDWWQFERRTSNRHCLLRYTFAIAYCDRLYTIDGTIGGTRCRAITNDWRRSIARAIVGSPT